MDTADEDSLQPALKKAEAELAKRLDEACDTDPEEAARGSADDLLRLEDELLAAARAAGQAGQLRRRLQERGGGERPASSTAPPPAEAAGRVRELRDRQGRAWRVWEVRPGLGRPLSDLNRYLGEYVNGWLAFGCLDNEIRKRLPSYPPNWFDLPDQELEVLLNSATDVRRKEVRVSKLDANA